MEGRTRVLAALNFQPSSQIPKDLGGMNSTGISAFAYSKLVAALGLPPRLPRVHDSCQMLALPDPDVLDALGCDVVHVQEDAYTNAFTEPERWQPYTFNGRLPALVRNAAAYRTLPDGAILFGEDHRMPPSSYVFDAAHGGQPLRLAGELPREDVARLRENLKRQLPTPERVRSIRDYCRRVRSATGRAVFFNGFTAGLGFRGGIPAWSMLCQDEPDYVHEIHAAIAEHKCEAIGLLLPEIQASIDVLMFSADDQGLQTQTILPPAAFRELFAPYYRQMNAAAHAAAPGVKIFLHSCGAIYPLLETVIECGFDVLNPVQWSAGKQPFRKWKDKARLRLALWGGGVNTQTTLPLGTVEDVVREAQEVAGYLARDSGYIFCAIHNLLAEIPPEKIIALYGAVRTIRLG